VSCCDIKSSAQFRPGDSQTPRAERALVGAGQLMRTPSGDTLGSAYVVRFSEIAVAAGRTGTLRTCEAEGVVFNHGETDIQDNGGIASSTSSFSAPLDDAARSYISANRTLYKSVSFRRSRIQDSVEPSGEALPNSLNRLAGRELK
jgi:hypothetical protein